MLINIAGIVSDSIVDGSGIRLTVFTQGCKHNCKGCHNPETHSLSKGKSIDTDSILKEVLKNPLLDGVTLSGGEPFLQAGAAGDLAKKVKEAGLNVWTYTGYTFEELLMQDDENILSLLKNTDVLVDGRFDLNNRTLDEPFKGSKNQRILDMKKSLELKKPVAFPL